MKTTLHQQNKLSVIQQITTLLKSQMKGSECMESTEACIACLLSWCDGPQQEAGAGQSTCVSAPSTALLQHITLKTTPTKPTLTLHNFRHNGEKDSWWVTVWVNALDMHSSESMCFWYLLHIIKMNTAWYNIHETIPEPCSALFNFLNQQVTKKADVLRSEWKMNKCLSLMVYYLFKVLNHLKTLLVFNSLFKH